MYKYILFDLDGTLVNTNQLVLAGLKATSEQILGKSLSNEEIHSILGMHLDRQMSLLSEEKSQEMVDFYRSYYKARQDSMIYEFPGIKEMLSDLKSLGCKAAVVSAKGRNGIQHALELFNMAGYFDVIVSAYDVENNKPHPEPALKALSLLEGIKEQALMIGDSPYDIMCGQSAGIKTVFVDWSIFPRDKIALLKPDFTIKEPKELISLIQKL